MMVHSLWGPEDIYGNTRVLHRASKRRRQTPRTYLVIGQWFHHSSGWMAAPSARSASAAIPRNISVKICCGHFSITT